MMDEEADEANCPIDEVNNLPRSAYNSLTHMKENQVKNRLCRSSVACDIEEDIMHEDDWRHFED